MPGWYSTYWVKMLNDIEVLDRPDTNFWMATAYTIPDTPHASVRPGETGFKSVPISRMVARSGAGRQGRGQGLARRLINEDAAGRGSNTR